MQFAVERALAAADLDWRFLSLDVAPERFHDALRGIDALGFQGASIAAPHRAAAAEQLDRHDAIARRAAWVDCITRDSDGQLVGHNLLGSALAASVDLDALVKDRAEPPNAVLIGEADHGSAACHGLLDGRILHWIVTDVDPEVLEPHGSARLPAVDESVKQTSPASAEREETGPLRSEPNLSRREAEERKATEAADVSPNALGHAIAPPTSEPPPSSEQDENDHGSSQAELQPIEPSAEGHDDSAAAPLRPESVITRAASLDEAINEDTVLIIRGVMADGQPAKFPEALLDRLEPPAMVVDMAISASTSALARAAAQRGLQSITRLDLLIVRTSLAMERWTGQTPDPEILREAFEEYLEI